MLSKSSKWELGSVHYIATFTILRLPISRFECVFNIIFYLFQLHLEAAHVLQYTEDEFLQTLDWKPFGHHEGQKTN